MSTQSPCTLSHECLDWEPVYTVDCLSHECVDSEPVYTVSRVCWLRARVHCRLSVSRVCRLRACVHCLTSVDSEPVYTVCRLWIHSSSSTLRYRSLKLFTIFTDVTFYTKTSPPETACKNRRHLIKFPPQKPGLHAVSLCPSVCLFHFSPEMRRSCRALVDWPSSAGGHASCEWPECCWASHLVPDILMVMGAFHIGYAGHTSLLS